MKKIFSQEFIRDNLDCYVRSNKRFLPKVEGLISEYDSDVTLENILTSSIRLQDKFWWLLTKCDITVEELKELSMRIADIAIIVYEDENPGDNKLRTLLNQAKRGENPLPELKDMISELTEPDSATTNAIKSVARASHTVITSGHKRPLTIKAVYRALVAARGNAEYQELFNDVLKLYY